MSNFCCILIEAGDNAFADSVRIGCRNDAPALMGSQQLQQECRGTVTRASRSEGEQQAFKKWLAARGAVFKLGRGGHQRVELNGRRSTLPMHSRELKRGLVEGIKE